MVLRMIVIGETRQSSVVYPNRAATTSSLKIF
jgi:hypothetical protein